jgi:hypothetical protein
MTEQLQMIHNKNRIVLINTVQCYLLQSVNRVEVELDKKRILKDKFNLGIKLVRGAYIQEELKEAQKLDREIVWDTKEKTDQNYNGLSQ